MDGFDGGLLAGLVIAGLAWAIDRFFFVRLSAINRELNLVKTLERTIEDRNLWRYKYRNLQLCCQQLITRLRQKGLKHGLYTTSSPTGGHQPWSAEPGKNGRLPPEPPTADRPPLEG